MHTLMVLEPEHFHAALPFKQDLVSVSRDVYVFAHAGQALEQFVRWIETFTENPSHPSNWKLHLRISDNPLEQLLDERPGDVVIVAGRNNTKARTVDCLASEGLHVLADKPLVVEPEEFRYLHDAMNNGVGCVADMMTCRYDPKWRLLSALVGCREVFGGFDTSLGDSLTIESLHFLAKTVAGKPLRRPASYFDVDWQGWGIADVSTHYVDQAFRLLHKHVGTAHEPRLVSSRAWPTEVSQADFCNITGEPDWSDKLSQYLNPACDVLSLYANGEFQFTVGNCSVRLRVDWKLRSMDKEPEGVNVGCYGTFAHLFLMRGKDASVCVCPGTGRDVLALRNILETFCANNSVCGVTPQISPCLDFPNSYIVSLHDETLPKHESQFADMLSDFIDSLDCTKKQINERDISKRYRLIMDALREARIQLLRNGWR